MNMMAILRWAILCVGLFCWGCASGGQPKDFTFTSFTDQAFPEVQEARLYRNGLGRPHRVIGEVAILGESDEGQESLEKRLVEAAGKVGAQGVVIVETAERVSRVGKAGVRNDLFGGASKRYRPYAPTLAIEEESIYIRGMAIRFIEE